MCCCSVVSLFCCVVGVLCWLRVCSIACVVDCFVVCVRVCLVGCVFARLLVWLPGVRCLFCLFWSRVCGFGLLHVFFCFLMLCVCLFVRVFVSLFVRLMC